MNTNRIKGYLKRLPWFICNRLSMNKWLPSKSLRITILKIGGVKFGEWCHVGLGVHFDSIDPKRFEFGNNVCITNGCVLLIHKLEVDQYGNRIWSEGNLKVGNNVYFGCNTIVTKPVTIGDNVIIGAGSIITKDIPSNCLVVGAPAKIIRRFISEKDLT